MDEPQDDGPPAVARQAVHGSPRGGGFLADDRGSLDVGGVRDGCGGLKRCLGTPALRAATLGDDVAGDLNSQIRNVDASGPSSRDARSSNRPMFASAARKVRSVASSAS